MRINALFFFCLCFTCFAASGQSQYGLIINKADSLYKIKEYSGSVFHYQKAFTERDGDATDFYNAACASALAGQHQLSFKFLDKALDAGWSNLRHLEQDKDLINLHGSTHWKAIIVKLEKLKEKRESGFDKPLYSELINILEDDQKIRKENSAAVKEFGPNSLKVDSLIRVMAFRDKVNLEKIIKILDTKGWPSRSLVGSEGIQAIFLVIQHADLATQERYFPMMQQASQKGDLRPEALAMLQDRILISKGKKQMYGSQIGQNKKTGVYYVLPLESPEEVDKRRSEIGLPPMKDYVSRWGLQWSLENYEKGLQHREERKLVNRPGF